MAAHHRRPGERCCAGVMNLFWWIVSFGILIGLFWLAKRAEPDLRSSDDGEHFDVKFKDIPFGPESKQSAADTVRQMKWHRGRGELIDDRVLVIAGPFAKVSPYNEPLPIIARMPTEDFQRRHYRQGRGHRTCSRHHRRPGADVHPMDAARRCPCAARRRAGTRARLSGHHGRRHGWRRRYCRRR